MGTGYSGLYKNTYGSRLYEYEIENDSFSLKEEISYNKKPTIDENAMNAKAKFGFDEQGRIGEINPNVHTGKQVVTRYITAEPEKDSIELFEILGNGGDKSVIGSGNLQKYELDDGTIVSHRMITKTPDSPAVEVSIRKTKINTKIISQKIHFERKVK